MLSAGWVDSGDQDGPVLLLGGTDDTTTPVESFLGVWDAVQDNGIGGVLAVIEEGTHNSEAGGGDDAGKTLSTEAASLLERRPGVGGTSRVGEHEAVGSPTRKRERLRAAHPSEDRGSVVRGGLQCHVLHGHDRSVEGDAFPSHEAPHHREDFVERGQW